MFKSFFTKIAEFFTRSKCNTSDLSAFEKEETLLKNSASLYSPTASPVFKSTLLEHLKQARRTQPAIIKPRMLSNWYSSLKNKMHLLSLVTVVSVVVVAVIITTSLFSPTQKKQFANLIIDTAHAQDNFTITPTKNDGLSIDTTTSFIITSKTPIQKDVLEKNIHILPEVPFTIETKSATEFVVTPERPLQNKSLYRVLINSSYVNSTGVTLPYDYSWVFQVKDIFAVRGTLPADRTSGVPVTTGIEVTFTRPDIKDFEKYFSITPAVPGGFERHGNTVVFVPKQPLVLGAIYQVTVKKGLPVENSSDTLTEDYTFRFETVLTDTNNYNQASSFVTNYIEYSTKDTPALPIGRDSTTEPAPVAHLEVYAFKSAQDFVGALKTADTLPTWSQAKRPDVSTNNLNKALTIDIKPTAYDYRSFIIFPKKLPAGYYLVQLSGDNYSHEQLFLQITDLVTYLTQTKTKTLVWVNDRATNNPASNVEVKLSEENKLLGKTDAQGAMLFDTKSSVSVESSDLLKDRYLVLSAKNSSAVIPLTTQLESTWDTFNPENYWSYLYTDRTTYQPNDTVRFWGFLQSKNHDAIKDVKAQFMSAVVDEQSITIDKYGNFSGEFKIKSAITSYDTLQIMSQDHIILSRGIQITKYIKPPYQITITPAKKAVFAKDGTDINIKTNFFDGTPVANVGLKYSFNYGTEQNFSVNRDGEAKLHLPIVYNSNYSPATYNIKVDPATAEESNVQGESFLTVFPAEVGVKSAITQVNSSTAKVHVTVNKIIIDKLNNGAGVFPENYLGAPAKNIPLVIKISATTYVQTEIGQYYDFINKRTQKTYSYQPFTDNLPDLSGVTNSEGTFDVTLPVTLGRDYGINVTAQDASGRKDTVYNSFYTHEESSSAYKNYSLHLNDGVNSTYKLGDIVRADFLRNGNSLNNEPGQFLFYTAQRGLINYKIQNSPHFEFPFTDEYIPNAVVYGAWFDGTVYHEVKANPWSGEQTAIYNTEDKKLTITVNADKPTYRPGEQVTLRYHIEDKNRKPVEADLNFNVVDEAYYALYDEAMNPLDSLYASVDDGFLDSYATHAYSELDPPGSGAEGGAGGGEGRQDFPDVALFKTVTTDAQGNGTLSFKLPDSVTSWRVTTQAVAPNLSAGSATTNLIVSLPLFLQTSLSHEYLATDRPTVAVRAYGTDLSSDEKVETQLQSDTLKVSPSEQSVNAFEPAYFDLLNLSLGKHTLRSQVHSKNASDATLQPIMVIPSRERMWNQTIAPLTSATRLNSATGKTKLTFIDKSKGYYFNQLNNLATTIGGRVDQQIGRSASQKILQNVFGIDGIDVETVDPTLYQQSGGGISLLPYSSSELELSMQIAATDIDDFDSSYLFGYFYLKNDDRTANRTELIEAYSGLAYLHEPVLPELKSLLALPDVTPIEKIYGALALAEVGDKEVAANMYADILRTYAQKTDQYIRLKVSNKQDENIKATAWMAVLSMQLDNPEADQLWSYAISQPTYDNLIIIPNIAYIKIALQKTSLVEPSFTLSLNNKDAHYTIKNGEPVQVNISGEQITSLSFKEINGNIDIIQQNAAMPTTTERQTNSLVDISRVYSVNNQPTTTFREGDLVKIELSTTIREGAVTGPYDVIDYLPTGLKIITGFYNPSISSTACYPYEVDGQVVKFGIARGSAWCGSKIVYYARVSGNGTFTGEPAIIQSLNSPTVKNFSAAAQVTIQHN